MKKLYRCIGIAACAGIALLPTLLAGAQDTGRQVPVELIEALLIGTAGPDRPEVMPGVFPANLEPRLFVPDEAQVLGSIVSPGSVTILMVSPGHPSEVQQSFASHLPARGWELPQASEPETGAPGRPRLYCAGDGSYLVVLAGPRSGDSSYVRLQYDTGATHSPCRTQRAATPSARPRHPEVRLEPPENASIVGRTRCANAGWSEVSTRMRTSLDLEQLAGVLQRQLEADGWILQASGGKDPLAYQQWRLRHADGTTWQCWLLLLRQSTSPDQVEIIQRISEAQGPHRPSLKQVR